MCRCDGPYQKLSRKFGPASHSKDRSAICPEERPTGRPVQRTWSWLFPRRAIFCTESGAVLTGRWWNSAGANHVKTIAVLPQPVKEAEAYLKGEGVSVDEIRQSSAV